MYNAAMLKELLKEAFRIKRMLDIVYSRSLGAKVIVIATNISNTIIFLFSNYNIRPLRD